MSIVLQNVIFPDDFFDKGRELFYIDNESLDFCTYLNSFSNQKWKKFTTIKNIILEITAIGNFKVAVKSFFKQDGELIKKTLVTEEYSLKSSETVQIRIPECNDTIIGFEVFPIEDFELLSAKYISDDVLKPDNEIKLEIIITTFKREEYLKNNISLLREHIVDQERINVVVIDNGSTLDREEIESKGIELHKNKNVGGSGGFSRGMTEVLKKKSNATHVLLMDDDVKIIPEAINKLYMFLSFLRTEYKEYFISGAMLDYDNVNLFHEDVGVIGEFGEQKPYKNKGLISEINNFIEIEQTEIKNNGKMFAAWWFCCIPLSQIKRNGLPLPLFVRVDDTEYSIRCKAEFITMNGICVWHKGFEGKFNYFMEYYQVFRNLMISNACDNLGLSEMFLKRFMIQFRTELLRFNYNAAEIILDALEDYLKGPEYIKKNLGNQLLVEKSKKNSMMKPIEEIEELFTKHKNQIDNIFGLEKRKVIDTFIYRLTFNGNRFIPKCLLKKEYAFIAYDYHVDPQRQALRRNLISYNPYERTYEIREVDQKRFKELKRRSGTLLKRYSDHHLKIEKEFMDNKDFITSKEFWESYLIS